ncbi:hypothetical protein SERLADRAFT_465174 [Serpula lacrymans var. lacrymans S7.9]|uniref:RING-type domain-containing protein n=1 Tax=Serpula lacrymans var. lacrymans (strain S7.9) TaxID=578457 RepID=F8NUW7_SERL9|nr:uncharacterized protein SERLADRAFT_465174 [Serpula lacrymans var. lacrymans S7.9]EGO25282.1 hypothetical protein SERLADRAFT_465174 [Serpula lacrymans var. lacrymans S7.9]
MAYTLFIPAFILLLISHVHGYIPALPTNDTTAAATQGGLNNTTDVSHLHIQWYSNGSFWQNVSYQLVGWNSSGITQGALVHFGEEYASNDTSTTPWIALIACDYNSTQASMEVDIFTLARERGAQSALLYSNYSQACIINPAYADPASFDQVMDIFSTQSRPDARVIEYQFGQSGLANETLYEYYDAKRLNESANTVNETIQKNNPVAPGYLFATLQAYNATSASVGSNNASGDSNNSSAPTTTGSGGSRRETGLAMIILYAITGCVSALFCVVIISGAIRAIRHPERYGPRLADGSFGGAGGHARSRARGLGRAILDTFPVVKFGTTSEVQQDNSIDCQTKDVEAQAIRRDKPANPRPYTVEMDEIMVTEYGDTEGVYQGMPVPAAVERSADTGVEEIQTEPTGESSKDTSISPRTKPGTSVREEHVMPDAIGRETCPICIVDFEEGDDLRVLPCEGKHMFHQNCVDPWLLELSSSCPICRQDFHALETMLSGEMDEDTQRHSRPYSSSHMNRLSRYLRFAKRRHDRRRQEDEDPTDPY